MPHYTEETTLIFKPALPACKNMLEQLRLKNNPNREPVGAEHGRCVHCGSDELWKDADAVGCNDCQALIAGNYHE